MKSKLDIWGELLAGSGSRQGKKSLSNDRLDLRDIVIINEAPLSPSVKVRNTRFESINFTGSSFCHHHFINCQFINCVFDKCKFNSCHFWDIKMEDCSMGSADLRGFGFSASIEEVNIYQRVRFRRADMRDIIVRHVKFIDCDFDNAKLKDCEFNGTEFQLCRFKGPVKQVVFQGAGYCHRTSRNEFTGALVNVDFTEAQLEKTYFKGVDLRLVKFSSGEIVHIMKDFGEITNKLYEIFSLNKSGIPRSIARQVCDYLSIFINNLLPNQSSGIFNLLDLQLIYGLEVRRIFSTALAGLHPVNEENEGSSHETQ